MTHQPDHISEGTTDKPGATRATPATPARPTPAGSARRARRRRPPRPRGPVRFAPPLPVAPVTGQRPAGPTRLPGTNPAVTGQDLPPTRHDECAGRADADTRPAAGGSPRARRRAPARHPARSTRPVAPAMFEVAAVDGGAVSVGVTPDKGTVVIGVGRGGPSGTARRTRRFPAAPVDRSRGPAPPSLRHRRLHRLRDLPRQPPPDILRHRAVRRLPHSGRRRWREGRSAGRGRSGGSNRSVDACRRGRGGRSRRLLPLQVNNAASARQESRWN